MNKENKMSNQEHITNLGLEIVDLIEKYGEYLPPYEMANILIAKATSLLLSFAPNERLAWKTLMASIENGVAEHEEHIEGKLCQMDEQRAFEEKGDGQ